MTTINYNSVSLSQNTWRADKDTASQTIQSLAINLCSGDTGKLNNVKNTLNNIATSITRMGNDDNIVNDTMQHHSDALHSLGFHQEQIHAILDRFITMAKPKPGVFGEKLTKINWFGILNKTSAIRDFINTPLENNNSNESILNQDTKKYVSDSVASALLKSYVAHSCRDPEYHKQAFEEVKPHLNTNEYLTDKAYICTKLLESNTIDYTEKLNVVKTIQAEDTHQLLKDEIQEKITLIQEEYSLVKQSVTNKIGIHYKS